jgi:hypothetical protein
MAKYYEVKSLFRRGYVKSLFVHSDHRSPEEMRDELSIFAKMKNFVKVDLSKMNEELWQLRLTEEVEIEEPRPVKWEVVHHFYIILHGGIWEFHTNERRDIIRKAIEGLIEFSPKLEYKFIPPDEIISLAKEYEADELLAFTAKREYFELVRASSELKAVGDEVGIRLRSTPERIWDHYHTLVEEEAIGPLSIGAVRLRITMEDRSCVLWINTLGQILQAGGVRDIFYDVRDRLLSLFDNQMRWELYIPIVEPQVFEDKKKGIVIRGERVIRRGRPFSIRLSKPFEEKEIVKLKGIFTQNIKKSGFIGVVEEEIEKKSLLIRTTEMLGGGDAIIIATVGKDKLIIEPQPTTTLRVLEKIYKVILEKFDTKAVFIEPKA